jgi:hypothetical protein
VRSRWRRREWVVVGESDMRSDGDGYALKENRVESPAEAVDALLLRRDEA